MPPPAAHRLRERKQERWLAGWLEAQAMHRPLCTATTTMKAGEAHPVHACRDMPITACKHRGESSHTQCWGSDKQSAWLPVSTMPSRIPWNAAAGLSAPASSTCRGKGQKGVPGGLAELSPRLNRGRSGALHTRSNASRKVQCGVGIHDHASPSTGMAAQHERQAAAGLMTEHAAHPDAVRRGGCLHGVAQLSIMEGPKCQLVVHHAHLDAR